ncbi:MAG TPA: exopolysaccharide biosynthesis polyprenyl glycosylphosphotransferase [Planctomycetota bacterium]|nr:exopolysaccharide biosynthesis polyprenyl glycosylphosphotransferase [Planctomycetota bacterium]
MATTGARRQSSAASLAGGKGGPSPVYLDVLWGYPFSLVRRLLIVFVCVLVSCFVGAYILAQPPDPLEILLHLVPVALAILISLYVAELIGVTERPLPPLGIEALFWAIATACISMGLGYAVVPTYAPSTTLACAAPVVSAVAVYVRRKWQEINGAREDIVPAVVFAGTREEAARGLAELADNPCVVVRSVLLPRQIANRTAMAGLPVRTPEEAMRHLREDGIRLVLVNAVPAEDLRPVLSTCTGLGCVVEQVDDLVARTQGRLNLTANDDIRLLNLLSTQAHRFPTQRVLDLLLVLVQLPVAVPVGMLCAIAVKLSSRGPVLYRQPRVGRWGHEFTIAKFRTMVADAEKMTGPVWAAEDDPRITTVGRFLRRTRLDEIPQLWNVIRGDMSLVGPRPERRFFVDSLREKIPLYDSRHAVRPGLTGWAQVRHAYAASDDDARMKLSYELFFVLNRSLTFYLTILMETVKVLIFQRGGR